MECDPKSLRNKRYCKSLSGFNAGYAQPSTISTLQNKINNEKKSYRCYLQKLSHHNINNIKSKFISMSVPKCPASNQNSLTQNSNNYSPTNNLLTRMRAKQPRLKQNRERRVRTQYGGQQPTNLFQHHIGAVGSSQQQQSQQQLKHQIKTTKNKTTPLSINPIITNPQQNKRYKSLDHQPLHIYLSQIRMNYHQNQQPYLQGQLTESSKMDNQNGGVNQQMLKKKQDKKIIDKGRHRNDRVRQRILQQTYQTHIIKNKLKINQYQNISSQQQLCPNPLSDYSSSLTDPHLRSNPLIQPSSLQKLAVFYKRKSKQRNENKIHTNKSKSRNTPVNISNQHNQLFIPSLLVKNKQLSLSVFDNLMRSIESDNKCKKRDNKCKNQRQNDYSRQLTIIKKKQQNDVQISTKHQHQQSQSIKTATAIISSGLQELLYEQIDMKLSQLKIHNYCPLSIKKENINSDKNQMRKYDERWDKIGKIIKQEIHDDKTELLDRRQENTEENTHECSKITNQESQHMIKNQKMNNISMQEKKYQIQTILEQQQKQYQHQIHYKQQDCRIVEQKNENQQKQINQNNQLRPEQNIQIIDKEKDNAKFTQQKSKLSKQNDNCSIY